MSKQQRKHTVKTQQKKGRLIDTTTTGQATGEEHSNSRVGSKIQDILEVLAGRHNYSKAT